MKTKHRCLAAFIAVCLILSPLTGCTKNKQETTGTTSSEATSSETTRLPELTGIYPEPSDGIGVPGKDFVMLKTASADNWQGTPVPKFNPLGSYSLYSEVRYIGADGEDIILHTLDGYTEKRETKRGERWELTITDPDYSLYWLRWYARESGGQWYHGTRDHSTFSVRESDTVTWWADARQTEEGAVITVLKVNTLPIETPLTLRPKELKGNSFSFYTPPTNGKLQSAMLLLKGNKGCGVSLKLTSSTRRGSFVYETDLSRWEESLCLKKSDRFVLDDLPITEGELCWELGWGENTPVPDEITIQLNTVAEIAPIQWGELPGAIRVTGTPAGGGAKVYTPDWANLSYPKVMMDNKELTGISDANGDMLFTAPAGYYNVRIDSGAGFGMIDESCLRLIPVSSGEITTITIPPEVTVSAGALSRIYGDFDQNEGGIELLSNKAQGDTATTTFVLNDPLERDLFPRKEDISITEDGATALVTNVEREPAGSDVILVLDSSGSMGENMKPCVEAAKRFVDSLPENSTIRLVQFSQQVTEHSGSDKARVIKALDSIKEGGATALYDATAKALSMLEGKKRGYAVVFSDGADSREPGVDGEGSAISKEQIIEQIKESGITVLTIGFGKGHDPATLIAMSEASKGGGYIAAADKSALVSAFASVAGKFGNQFTVTYQRPTIPLDQSGTVPVVSMMIDRSGSMDTQPELNENVGWRIDRIKEIFHNFILKLPPDTLMQLGSFAEPEGGRPPRFDQLITDQKANILQAMGSLEAGGGTPTDVALKMAYYNLSPVPSQKRVLVFFTDAGLYDPENPEELDDILIKYKESGIRVLFAGLSDQAADTELDTIFKTAAKKAGGDYILTDNMEGIAKKLDELLAGINTPSEKKGVDFTLGLDCKTENGGQTSFYSASNLPDFTPKTGAGKRIDPQIISVKAGERYIIYNGDAANLLYGGDQPQAETNVLLRIPFQNIQGSNGFCKLNVTEAYLMDLFKGLPAPVGQAYLALNVSLEFSKKDQVGAQRGYSVPNIFNHFYVSANKGHMMPPSQATWLAEKPFAMPGENEVTVFEKGPRSGMLIFLIDWQDSNRLTQLSLHMYDTSNGHIELPLTGSLTKQMLAMHSLPTQPSAQMSNAFSLAITGKTDQTTLGEVELPQADAEYSLEAAKKNTSFRVLEAKFESKVQALLDIDPVERFYYQIETDQGVLMTPMSDVVHHLPLGFAGSTLLAPGSCSNVRLPFVLPNELLDSKSSVYADLATSSQRWDIMSGQPYQTGSAGKKYSHEYFDLTIHSLSVSPELNELAVLDFTLHDKKDSEGTAGLESVLQLQRRNSSQSDEIQQAVAGRSGLADFAGSNENIITASVTDTNELIFAGIQENGSWGAFDGQSRRGILLFHFREGEPDDWILTSPLLPELQLPVSATPYPYDALLAKKPPISINDDFERALNEAVSSAIAAYQATRPEPRDRVTMGLSDDEVMGKQVPSPSLTLYGSQQIKAVKTDADFLNLMRGLRWIPSHSESSAFYRYAPEAVITQGWGGQYDLAILAKTLLARLGYQPEYRTVTMTAAGQQNLRQLSGLEQVPEKLIGVFYTDAQGQQKLFLPIFSADLSELMGLGYLGTDDTPVEIFPAMGRIQIQLYGKLTGNAADLMSADAGLWESLGASLSGEEGGNDFYETVTIFDRQLSLPDLSLDALDISYLSKPKRDGGTLLLPILDTRQGLIYDSNSWVDSSYYAFERLDIILDDNGNSAVHTTMLPNGQRLNEITHTLAWGVPELSNEAAKSIEFMAKAEAAAAKEPANYSVSRWLGHATLSRLIKGLTEAGSEYAKALGIIAGRSDQSIALMVTTKSDGKTAETSVDLVNHRNQLHSGDEHAHHAYNLMYGYFASDMEAAALPGGEGYGYSQVWSSLPQGAKIRQIPIEDSSSLDAAIEEFGLKDHPALLLERMRGGSSGIAPQVLYLVPDRPAEINGKPRWAWLEIDMVSYDVVSVFETGQRAGMGEYLIGCLPGNGNYAEVGAGMLVGVTTAVGSVAAYTLTGEDYQTVIALAKAKCTEIGALMGIVTGVTGAIDATGKIAEGVSGMQLEKLFEANEGIWVNKLTFVDGYNYAVEAYFKTT